MSDPVAPSGAGTRLTVHLQPRASVTEIAGLHGDAVKVRVAAPPVDGAANDEVVALVARLVGVPRRAVRLVSGAASRRKQLVIDGVAPAAVRRALGLTP